MRIYTLTQKCFFTALMFLGITAAAQAQNYTFPDGLSATGFPTNNTDEFFVHLKIVNQTDAALQLHWKMLENTFDTAMWENISLCDPYTCHLQVPASFDPAMEASAVSEFKLGATPKHHAASAFMSIAVWQDGFVADTITLTMDVSTVGIEKNNRPATSALKVYPNPAISILSLDVENTQNKIVEIYTLAGQKVLSEGLSSTKTININALPQGMYFLKTLDSKGNSSISKFLKQ